MTLSDLIAEVRSIINETDSANSHFTDTTITGWLNEAQNDAATRLSSYPEQSRDFSASASAISHTGNLIAPIAAFFYDPVALDWYRLDLMSTQDMVRMYPDYLNTEAGKPDKLIRTGAKDFTLYPAPDTTNLSGTLKIIALENPTALSALSSVSELPQACHYLLPHYAAFRCFQQLDRAESATQEISIFTSGMKQLKYLITNPQGMNDTQAIFRESDS